VAGYNNEAFTSRDTAIRRFGRYFAYVCVSPTPRDASAYIMDTFPIVKRKDEAKYKILVHPGHPCYPAPGSGNYPADGGPVEVADYRTKRVILELYDALQRAITTGTPYQTLLFPPPASPECAHSALTRST
jgi:hypothetical protein